MPQAIFSQMVVCRPTWTSSDSQPPASGIGEGEGSMIGGQNDCSKASLALYGLRIKIRQVLSPEFLAQSSTVGLGKRDNSNHCCLLPSYQCANHL